MVSHHLSTRNRWINSNVDNVQETSSDKSTSGDIKKVTKRTDASNATSATRALLADAMLLGKEPVWNVPEHERSAQEVHPVKDVQ
ncbi:unnamed protein product [Fusarium venenatum]|uniref:Uncharacterized protein n=1 Tax=Fusarium venenatum TaxID=56646 RepID=A0A2L2TPC9_9HYPO|nr:uncharacterized protein FVRRES_05721 [Fusarium venenatum]CEI61285.1 unnamed protein product [Fusarium venenatum]